MIISFWKLWRKNEKRNDIFFLNLVKMTLQANFTNMINEMILTNYSKSCQFQNVVCLYYALVITRDIYVKKSD